MEAPNQGLTTSVASAAGVEKYAGPLSLPQFVADSHLVTTKIGDFTLHVPANYIDASDGFQDKFGYIRIRALLPCLVPETPENAAEFHKNTLGNILVASLATWDGHYLTGEKLLQVHIANDRSVGHLRPDLKGPEKTRTCPAPNFNSINDTFRDATSILLKDRIRNIW
jgi:hypothetical protein